MSAILTEIIGILTGGLTSFGQGLGAGIQSIITALFIDSSGTTPALSTFGGVITIFAAIGLAVGITRRIFNWLVTLGGRK